VAAVGQRSLELQADRARRAEDARKMPIVIS
jgi:hypothetical protein